MLAPNSDTPAVTVVTVNYNTTAFVALILEALAQLSCSPYRVLICDNGSKPRELARLKRLEQDHQRVDVIYRRQSSPGSIAHAEALDILLAEVDTPYTAILDSDCTFLLQDWDKILMAMLDDTVKIVGSTSPSAHGGSRIGAGTFPHPFAVMLETRTYRDLGVSCLPRDIRQGEDTCWEWVVKYLENGFEGRVLDPRNTRDYKEGPFGSLIGIEEYYLDDGRLLASHFGRGASSGAAKYFRHLRLPFIPRLLRRLYGRRDKRRWLRICRDLISKQTTPSA